MKLNCEWYKNQREIKLTVTENVTMDKWTVVTQDKIELEIQPSVNNLVYSLITKIVEM
jgi:hypothetical protein